MGKVKLVIEQSCKNSTKFQNIKVTFITNSCINKTNKVAHWQSSAV